MGWLCAACILYVYFRSTRELYIYIYISLSAFRFLPRECNSDGVTIDKEYETLSCPDMKAIDFPRIHLFRLYHSRHEVMDIKPSLSSPSSDSRYACPSHWPLSTVSIPSPMDDLPGGFSPVHINHYVCIPVYNDRSRYSEHSYDPFIVTGSGMLATVSGERSSERYYIQSGLLVCGDGMSCVKVRWWIVLLVNASLGLFSRAVEW